MNVGTVTLDNDMIWKDEFEFTPTAGTANYAIDGHLVVQSFATIGGRPMTLTGEGDRGWQSCTTVLALQALASVPGNSFIVTLPDARTFEVEFRVEDQPTVAFTPITSASAPDPDFWYYGTINLRLVV